MSPPLRMYENSVQTRGVALGDVPLVILHGNAFGPDLIEQDTCVRRQRVACRPCFVRPEARAQQRLGAVKEALLDLDANRKRWRFAVYD